MVRRYLGLFHIACAEFIKSMDLEVFHLNHFDFVVTLDQDIKIYFIFVIFSSPQISISSSAREKI